MKEKLKVLVLADHPFSPSGVGTQTRYMIEHLMQTKEYSFVCFGGAVKHNNYQPQKFEKWGDDFIIYPVDGYGTQEMVRSIIRTEKPDILWFMTDPRFYPWLWEIEDEIRSLIPMVYYHVWDNKPYPHYNKIWYDSTDLVVTISKVTQDIVENVAPEVDSIYHPHAVNPEFFKPFSDEEKLELRNNSSIPEDKFVVFWNSRNARRKHSATLVHWFKEFADKVGHDKVQLIMHTDPSDPNGPNLVANINMLGLTNGEVQFSTQKLDFPELAGLYNIADVTVCISDAEGFGLSTLESLSCGTPIIVNMTGGLQEQVTDGESWFGIGIEPCSKSIIGSQQVPYIYEDRISKEDFHSALDKMYEMSKKDRNTMGLMGSEHVNKNYNFDTLITEWVETMDNISDKFGSWDTRKGYDRWNLEEIM